MDVREKLVELLKEVVAIQECSFGDPRPTYDTVASYLIVNGVTVLEWIPVTERLPERTRSYIVCTDKGAICTAKFYSDLPTGLRYEKPHWNNSRLNKHITHWCEMPQPPKGE